MVFCIFFFFKQNTAYELRISDWSSDVCSSDLDAEMLLMTGTCGSLGAAPGAYWIAEALQHDYGASQPGLFRRYRAGAWPIGEAGEAHFTAMADPGLDLPHARIASGDSFVACPDAAADQIGSASCRERVCQYV